MSSVTEELKGFATFVKETLVAINLAKTDRSRVAQELAQKYERQCFKVADEILIEYDDTEGVDYKPRNKQGRLL